MYTHGLVGNCQASALVNASGHVDWLCLPRPDSPPLVGRLLDVEGGTFCVEPEGPILETSQRYLANTNVLETRIRAGDGVFVILDFCPRFEQYGRMFRPPSLFRIVRPVEGSPRIRVSCRPVNGWDKEAPTRERGNAHLRFSIGQEHARLATTFSLTHLCDETSFPLDRTGYLALTWSHGIEDDLVRLSEEYLERTTAYWRTWVKHCSVPTQFQQETIRSALALKLHCFEETGAILASPTTSLPEFPGEVRNWDYRFCWLRDAYYTLSAFHQLGHFEEMEGFLRYILGLVRDGEPLAPVFRVDGTLPLPELEHGRWKGFADSQPVRSGNLAAKQVQHDIYGELVLALAPIYLDERFEHLRTDANGKLMVELGQRCAATLGAADAGLWELRAGDQEHSFSNLMSWAALSRLNTIGRLETCNQLAKFAPRLADETQRAENHLRAACVDGSLRNGPTDSSHNAALLQMVNLRFPDAALCAKTVDEIAKDLRFDDTEEGRWFMFRYKIKDDFGVPRIPFVFCSFWLIQAMAKLGRKEEALIGLKAMQSAGNSLGLFAEHYDPLTKTQWGNFPQAYSHTGQILSAFAASPPWDEVL